MPRAAQSDRSGRSPSRESAVGVDRAARNGSAENTVAPLPTGLRWWDYLVASSLAVSLFAWIFHEDLRELVRAWDREPDYSHGYLVIPAALLFLWVRRDRYPGVSRKVAWGGIILVGIALIARAAGYRYYFSPLMGWSMILWVAGVCWLLGGRRFFAWMSPALLFLFFMVPLPYRSEQWLGQPLQKLAAKVSTATLQIAGQPAIAQGNTILLGDLRLEVEHACAGLRMLVGIAALAMAYGVLTRRGRSEMLLLALSIVPVALLANCARITATGIAYQYLPDEASRALWHDAAGWAVIPLAALLMAALLAYWNRLFQQSESTSVQEMVGEAPSRHRAAAQPQSGMREATHV